MNEQFTLEGFEQEDVEEEENNKKKDNYLGSWGEATAIRFFQDQELECYTSPNDNTSADLLIRIIQNDDVKYIAVQIKTRRI